MIGNPHAVARAHLYAGFVLLGALGVLLAGALHKVEEARAAELERSRAHHDELRGLERELAGRPPAEPEQPPAEPAAEVPPRD